MRFFKGANQVAMNNKYCIKLLLFLFFSETLLGQLVPKCTRLPFPEDCLCQNLYQDIQNSGLPVEYYCKGIRIPDSILEQQVYQKGEEFIPFILNACYNHPRAITDGAKRLSIVLGLIELQYLTIKDCDYYNEWLAKGIFDKSLTLDNKSAFQCVYYNYVDSFLSEWEIDSIVRDYNAKEKVSILYPFFIHSDSVLFNYWSPYSMPKSESYTFFLMARGWVNEYIIDYKFYYFKRNLKKKKYPGTEDMSAFWILTIGIPKKSKEYYEMRNWVHEVYSRKRNRRKLELWIDILEW